MGAEGREQSIEKTELTNEWVAGTEDQTNIPANRHGLTYSALNAVWTLQQLGSNPLGKEKDRVFRGVVDCGIQISRGRYFYEYVSREVYILEEWEKRKKDKRKKGFLLAL